MTRPEEQDVEVLGQHGPRMYRKQPSNPYRTGPRNTVILYAKGGVPVNLETKGKGMLVSWQALLGWQPAFRHHCRPLASSLPLGKEFLKVVVWKL